MRTRLWSLPVAVVAATACNPRDATVEPERTSERAPVDEVMGACAAACDDPLPRFATSVEVLDSGQTIMQIVAPTCELPGFHLSPRECTAMCDEHGRMASVRVGFGALGRGGLQEMCWALLRHRGQPTEGTCDDPTAGVHWPAVAGHPSMSLTSYVELGCP